MKRSLQLVSGTLAMILLITGAAAISAWPSYRATPEGSGMLKLSLSHGGARNCRPLTEAELAKLPPNMRRKEKCERGRLPVYVAMAVDGKLVYSVELPPGGLAGDGPSRVYQKFVLPAGTHDVVVQLRDTARAEGFDFESSRSIDIAAGQNYVIDFNPDAGGFVFN